jgi:hypothetical protein
VLQKFPRDGLGGRSNVEYQRAAVWNSRRNRFCYPRFANRVQDLALPVSNVFYRRTRDADPTMESRKKPFIRQALHIAANRLQRDTELVC